MTTHRPTPPSVPTPEDDVDAWEGSSFDLRHGLDVIELPPTDEPPTAHPGDAASPPSWTAGGEANRTSG
jgi:hypothetical protein